MTDMTDTNGLPLRTTSARRHVLAVRADSLGDVVVTGPAVRAIAASGARVTMLCSPQGAPAGSRLPGVAEVVVERLPWIDADPQPVERAAMEGLVDRLATHGFDEASGVCGIVLATLAMYGGSALALEDAQQREPLPLFRRGGAQQAFEGYERHLGRLEAEPGVRQQL